MADRRQQGLARILASDGAAFDAQDALSALGTYNSQLPPESKAYSQRLGEALLTTWPAQMAKSAFQAATLPGDVYAGKVDPLSEQGIGRALDLAGLVTLGSGAFPAAKGAGQELRAGIKAYHGSPHDFDKFQLSKIGTGEGAQAYGHGLYFAENEAIAKSYRDALKGLAPMPPELKALPDDMRRSIAQQAGADVAPDLAAKRAGYSSVGVRKMDPAEVEKMIVGYRDAARGRMYEVNINADPAKMLDWDASLAQQSKPVKEILQNFGYRDPAAELRTYDDALLNALMGDAKAPLPKQPPNPTGGAIYESSKLVPGGYRDPVAAAQALREAGIPGIKYLDAGSRSAGEGSRNFVIFDDSLIDIMRKYGVGSLAALPPAVLAGVGITPDQAQAADAQRLTQAAQEIVRE